MSAPHVHYINDPEVDEEYLELAEALDAAEPGDQIYEYTITGEWVRTRTKGADE